MRTFKRETLIKMYVATLIIAVITAVVMIVVQFTSGAKEDLMMWVMCTPIIIIAFPLLFCGLILNLKKTLVGLIAPIPILSCFYQWYIVGFIYAIKGLIAIFKHQDLVIGSEETSDD
ncbi:MAG: hypothetical protein ACI4XE_02190 [Acutalibacteraceae bacterium]